MTAVDDLRSAQVDVTRARIGHAVVDVLVRDGAERLSFPAVAEAAGVSLRTVYRHFPNKDALVAAALHAGTEATARAYPVDERTLANLSDFLPASWRELHSNLDLVRAQHATAAGVELRAERLRARRDVITDTLADELPDVPAADRRRLAALVTVLMGTPLLVDLVEHLGLDVDDAAGLSVFAIHAAVEAARTSKGIRA